MKNILLVLGLIVLCALAFAWGFQGASAETYTVSHPLSVVNEYHQKYPNNSMVKWSLYKVYDENNDSVCYVAYSYQRSDTISVSCLK